MLGVPRLCLVDEFCLKRVNLADVLCDENLGLKYGKHLHSAYFMGATWIGKQEKIIGCPGAAKTV